ncbi:ROK family protein [Flavivirga sp. 57AJ16]|uniref:ROK family protein n=1 Tax=Flavivirga sp. 57AJ16 TaxID=3025307 RepID=UPI0023661FAD|nr:ROK family protein [Flavivirga sp. 57AJ16]MDD7887541.1 ROK family protein [Flavivirga sp. 57AJ16]
MRDVYSDDRIVMTLDAGGTNFVFSAIQGGKHLIKKKVLPSNSDDINNCLNTIVKGFKEVRNTLGANNSPSAISFAFPGPADYKRGIIGDLTNFPSFNGGVALGPMLENIFKVPTLINNDGDLFAYGEAIAGFLPYVNSTMKDKNLERRYTNLIGITIGTGFGAGIVVNNQVCFGDNSAAGEIWLTRNYLANDLIAEEGVSIRAIKRTYMELSNLKECHLEPKEIYLIAKGVLKGNKEAAIEAYGKVGTVIGESLATAITLMDAPVVIGGGISGASEFIVPNIVEHLNGTILDGNGRHINRIISKAFSIDDPKSFPKFLNDNSQILDVPFSDKKVRYNPQKLIPIGLSRLGTSDAICLGAYTLAINYLEEKRASTPVYSRK